MIGKFQWRSGLVPDLRVSVSLCVKGVLVAEPMADAANSPAKGLIQAVRNPIDLHVPVDVLRDDDAGVS